MVSIFTDSAAWVPSFYHSTPLHYYVFFQMRISIVVVLVVAALLVAHCDAWRGRRAWRRVVSIAKPVRKRGDGVGTEGGGGGRERGREGGRQR